MAKTIVEVVQDFEEKTNVFEAIHIAKLDKFAAKVAYAEDVLKTVILYGQKTHYFREVNEFIKKKNAFVIQGDTLESKVNVLEKIIDILKGSKHSDSIK